MNIRLICLGLLLTPLLSNAQTTFNTVPPLNGGNGSGGISFQLSTNSDITVQNFSGAFQAANQDIEIWYSPTDLTGPPTISLANGWTQVGSTNLTGISSGLTPTLQDIPIDVNLFMSAGTTYRYYIGSATGSVIYSNPGGTSSFTNGTVTFETGSNIGYGGSIPNPTFHVRQFNGGVTYVMGRIPDSAIEPAEDLPAPFIATNNNAINSLLSTGLLMGSVNRSVTRGANSAPSGVMRQRLFMARASKPTGEGFQVNASRKSAPTSRYLNFAANLNIDYRVALGLAEGREIQIGDSAPSFEKQRKGAVSISPPGEKAVVPSYSSAKQAPEGKVPYSDETHSRFQGYSQFDYGFYDQDPLTPTIRGFETDSYAGSVGLDYHLNNWLMIGAAFSHLQSDTVVAGNLGGVDVEGQFYSAYATASLGDSWLDVSYSYGDLSNDLFRNTLLGTTALGETDSHSHNIDLNLGHNIAIDNQVSFGPTLGLGYSNGETNGYTERGGGPGNIVFPDDSFESLISKLGLQVTFNKEIKGGDLTLQGRAAWAHEYMPEGNQIAGSLQSSPFSLITPTSATTATSQSTGGFTATSSPPEVGADWLELGASVRLDLNNQWHAQAGYEGMFGRDKASAHFGSVRIGYEW